MNSLRMRSPDVPACALALLWSVPVIHVTDPQPRRRRSGDPSVVRVGDG